MIVPLSVSVSVDPYVRMQLLNVTCTESGTPSPSVSVGDAGLRVGVHCGLNEVPPTGGASV
jgi:hypothetical protein